MLDKIQHFTIKETKNGEEIEKEYPVAFTLNVAEAIQEKYGSLAEWGDVLQPKSNGEPIEPSLKDVLWVFGEMINEGIDIENEEMSKNQKFITHKQVGRLLTKIGMKDATGFIQGLAVDSMTSKNAEATQN